MFRYDLSLLSAYAFRSTQGHNYQSIGGDPCEDVPQRKQRQEQRKTPTPSKLPSSPARTARTQLSSTCSINNSNNSKAELDLSRISSVSSNGFDLPSPPKQYYHHQTIAFKEAGQPNGIRRVLSGESLGKLSPTFSSVGKNVSFLGKNVLKSLRNNMSLMKSSSFDSRTSNNSRRSRKKRRKKSLSTIPRDVKVSVVEGEGVEILTKPSDSDWGYYSSDSECDNIRIPKIIRGTSTFATSTSLTSGEETENAEIFQDDADILKLCSLMEKIRSNSQDEEDELKGGSDGLNSNSFDWSFGPSQEIEVSEESFRANSEVSPLQPEADAFVDLMIFVNNEHRVLEFTPDEF